MSKFLASFLILVMVALNSDVVAAARRHDAAMKRESRASSSSPARGEAIEPTFRGAALQLQNATEHEIVISGPYETGKTFATLWRIDSLLREYRNSQALMVRKVRADMDSSCIQTYRKIIERRGGVTVYGGEKPQWFDYGNGARLWVAGLDNPGKALSAEYDFIYPNQAEQLSLDDWETLTTRCTGRANNAPFSQILGDCNPGPEDHWILKRQASGALRLLNSYHRDNPRLYNDDGTLTDAGAVTMRILDALTGVRRKRGRDGEWVGAEGQYFEEWDDERHVCEPFDIPADWPIWGALDYGMDHPTAFGLFTQDSDGVIYLVAEHVKNNWLVPLHCKAIRRQVERAGVEIWRLKQIAAGHDVFQKKRDASGISIAQRYEEAKDPETGENIGLTGLEHANVDRIAGWSLIAELLGNKEMEIKPRLKIFNWCKRTIACVKRLVKDPRDPEDVLKINADANGEGGDDEGDMLRYGVMAKPEVGMAGLFSAGASARGW